MASGMLRAPVSGETRSDAQIREHYEIERELADRLRRATAAERARLYTAVYDELFRRVPHHQQLTRKASPERAAKAVAWQVGLLRRFLTPDTAFLEIGAGDCALSMRLAPAVGRVWAADVSAGIATAEAAPANFRLLLIDGLRFPLEPATVDVAYSNQLMEHLHPDDASTQLADIYRVLRPGGRYVCVTPNRLNGPWDISMYFDQEATGFHMKEYTFAELAALFRQVGFRTVRAYAGAQGHYVRIPAWSLRLLEGVLGLLPWRVRAPIARTLPFRAVLGLRVEAVK